MPSPKDLLTYGLLGKIETTYGTDSTPVAGDDGILLAEKPSVAMDYIFSGERGDSPATGGKAPAAAPGGRFAEFTASLEGIGGGAAYSATVVPSVDVLLRIAGMEATLDATGAAETITYVPEAVPADMDSATFEVYERGQKFDIVGAYAESFTVSVDGPGIPIWEFPVKGISDSLPSDAAVPAISSYPSASNLPPNFVNVSLDIGGVTSLKCRSFSLDLGRELAQRADGNAAAGHAGYQPGRRSPTLEMVVEAEALATWNPYSIREAGTLSTITFTVGGTQYKTWTLTAKGRIQDISEDEDGTAAIWGVTFGLASSDYATIDDLSIVFD